MPTPRARGRDVSGVLLLDKPRGLTSNDALQRIKRLYQANKAGHTGSLDPLATGMLPICFGNATRLSTYLLDAHKSYAVAAQLGVATDTADADGTVIERRETPQPDAAAVAAALDGFRGETLQTPPMYSALKQDGVRLYELARKGVSVPRESRRIVIESLVLDDYRWPELRFTVRCSKGTYVRSLVTDVAAALGTLGHVRELRRLAVDPFGAASLATLEELEALEPQGTAVLDARLMPAEAALADWPAVHLTAVATDRLAHGQTVAVAADVTVGRTKVYGADGRFLAIGEVAPGGTLAPLRVFRR